MIGYRFGQVVFRYSRDFENLSLLAFYASVVGSESGAAAVEMVPAATTARQALNTILLWIVMCSLVDGGVLGKDMFVICPTEKLRFDNIYRACRPKSSRYAGSSPL